MNDEQRPPFGSEDFLNAIEAALAELERWFRARRYRKARRHLEVVRDEPGGDEPS